MSSQRAFMGVGVTLARTLPARRNDEVGGSEKRMEKLSRILRETHQSSVAVNAAHAYTMREEEGMSE
ncbi:hypothetical protein ALC53_07153 [Atta colombica]|uniref:Uncharacterized protein n=1 Tax=Atta colombica TaxID=520822 RepID=A0A195BDW0_9HYME|nr:hypothetical protein ALC53_07153 [Atta colombica]